MGEVGFGGVIPPVVLFRAFSSDAVSGLQVRLADLFDDRQASDSETTPRSANDEFVRSAPEPGVVCAHQYCGDGLHEPYVHFADPGSYRPFTVPAGHLFVMGDNRPDSSD